MRKFRISNGVVMRVTGLNYPQMRRVYLASRQRKPPLSRVYPYDRRNFFAITAQLEGGDVHFIYRRTRKRAFEHVTATSIRNALKRYQWDILEKAWFIVYNYAAYEVDCPLAFVFVRAVRQKMNLNVALILYSNSHQRTKHDC
jgi:hypothetical protein